MLAVAQVLVEGILSSSEQTTYETVAIRTDILSLQVSVTTHYICMRLVVKHSMCQATTTSTACIC